MLSSFCFPSFLCQFLHEVLVLQESTNTHFSKFCHFPILFSVQPVYCFATMFCAISFLVSGPYELLFVFFNNFCYTKLASFLTFTVFLNDFPPKILGHCLLKLSFLSRNLLTFLLYSLSSHSTVLKQCSSPKSFSVICLSKLLCVFFNHFLLYEFCCVFIFTVSLNIFPFIYLIYYYTTFNNFLKANAQ